VAKAARKDATEDFGTFQRCDNRYYIKAGADDLGRGLVANRGYFSTIKPATGNAITNVNTTMSTFFKPMLLSNFMEPFSAENRTKLECILKGLKVCIECLEARIVKSILTAKSGESGRPGALVGQFNHKILRKRRTEE
jgi:hypothetical protein